MVLKIKKTPGTSFRKQIEVKRKNLEAFVLMSVEKDFLSAVKSDSVMDFISNKSDSIKRLVW